MRDARPASPRAKPLAPLPSRAAAQRADHPQEELAETAEDPQADTLACQVYHHSQVARSLLHVAVEDLPVREDAVEEQRCLGARRAAAAERPARPAGATGRSPCPGPIAGGENLPGTPWAGRSNRCCNEGGGRRPGGAIKGLARSTHLLPARQGSAHHGSRQARS